MGCLFIYFMNKDWRQACSRWPRGSTAINLNSLSSFNLHHLHHLLLFLVALPTLTRNKCSPAAVPVVSLLLKNLLLLPLLLPLARRKHSLASLLVVAEARVAMRKRRKTKILKVFYLFYYFPISFI